ncbi:MAG: DUF2237 family protein [Paracoccaceae bacterium]
MKNPLLDKYDSVNVLDGELQPCSFDPMTGFFRDGCCNTNALDVGSHTVCTYLTEEFLAFSKKQGNDLTTPKPEFGFEGLNPGDKWCLCATRWLEAENEGCAPKVSLASTHKSALDIIPIELLKKNALDMN